MKFLKKLNNVFTGKSVASNDDQATYINGEDVHIPVHNINKNARKVIKRLHQGGYRAFLVGGAVRDLLLDKEPKDFDVATNAVPEQVRQSFRNCRLIGRRFRLAHVYYYQDIIEVSTFRSNQEFHQNSQADKEGMIVRDNAYGKLKEDVWRRDFTINALYFDPESEQVIDYTGGLDDIDDEIVRMIGDPIQRYREDPIRMLRAVRFAAKLNFNIEAATQAPFQDLQDLLWNVSSARLYEEVQKLLFSGHAKASYDRLHEHHFITHLFPLVEPFQEDNNYHRLINTALINTDQRIAIGKSINPAFLLAVILWLPLCAEIKKQRPLHDKIYLARATAMDNVLRQQLQTLAIPKRFTNTIREIWELQFRLRRRFGKRAFLMVAHKRFRAGYDFLLLRTLIEPDLQSLADWWTTFQEVDHDEQAHMVQILEQERQSTKNPPS